VRGIRPSRAARQKLTPAQPEWDNGVVVFLADDLGAWLTGLLADRFRRKLATVFLGDDLDRALRPAATAAIELTAAELSPDDDGRAEEMAMVINEVFRTPAPDTLLAQHKTVLRALQAGIGDQLAVLDDASHTGVGQSSAALLDVPTGEIADKLTGHLVQEIIGRATRGGALEPLAAQLNHDVTHLQAYETQRALGQLRTEILEAVVPVAAAHEAQLPRSQAATDIALHVEQSFEGLQLDQHDEAEHRLFRLFLHLTPDQQRVAIAAIIRVATTTDDHTVQLVACSLLEAADRLDSTLITIEDIAELTRSDADSLRGTAANLMWQWAESIPGRVPIPLLSRLTQPSTEDWYVHAPARCAAKQLLLSRASARAIFDRMAASRDRHDRDYAASDLLEVAEIEPRAVPLDLARKLASGEAASGAELLRMLKSVTERDRWDYRHKFGL
jgi:hypothetical protein